MKNIYFDLYLECKICISYIDLRMLNLQICVNMRKYVPVSGLFTDILFIVNQFSLLFYRKITTKPNR